jgi:hypothetical protein
MRSTKCSASVPSAPQLPQSYPSCLGGDILQCLSSHRCPWILTMYIFMAPQDHSSKSVITTNMEPIVAIALFSGLVTFEVSLLISIFIYNGPFWYRLATDHSRRRHPVNRTTDFIELGHGRPTENAADAIRPVEISLDDATHSISSSLVVWPSTSRNTTDYPPYATRFETECRWYSLVFQPTSFRRKR